MTIRKNTSFFALLIENIPFASIGIVKVDEYSVTYSINSLDGKFIPFDYKVYRREMTFKNAEYVAQTINKRIERNWFHD